MSTAPGWQISELCVEAIRNVFGRGSRLRIVSLLAVTTGAGLSLFSMFEWRELRSDVEALNEDGWNTFVVAVPDDSDNGVSARSCSRLADTQGVVSVAAIGTRTPTQFVELGARTVPVVAVGLSSLPDDAPVVPPSEATPVMVGTDLLRSLESVRTLVSRTGITYSITHSLPTELELANLSGSVVVPVPLSEMRGEVEQCYVSVEAWSDEAIGVRLASSVSVTTLPVSVRRVLESGGAHPYDRFLARSSATVYFGVGVVMACASALSMRSRASEFGVYRVAGTTKMALAVLLALENALVVGIWALSAATSSIALEHFTSLPTTSSWLRQITAIAICSGMTGGFAGIAVRRGVTLMLKDR